jgi:metal-responsive CopG/Arc/MetJ family transcriptional regulator
MNVVKLSISLPTALAGFVERYRKERGLRSRSQVFEEALKLLRSRHLESAYREASADDEKLNRDWASTVSDGLTDETW